MTAFDILILFLLGTSAIFGFMRGFVQEALSLISWVLIIAAVRLLHAPVTDRLVEPVGTESGASVLAFLAITVIAYALGKWISKSIGKKTRSSVLGPIDRVLGFGFGILKGLIIGTIIFSLLVMGYEILTGEGKKRPEWMTQSRTYPLLNASGDAMSVFIAERRKTFAEDINVQDDAAAQQR
jgi:membrane protein required for colicin V production